MPKGAPSCDDCPAVAGGLRRMRLHALWNRIRLFCRAESSVIETLPRNAIWTLETSSCVLRSVKFKDRAREEKGRLDKLTSFYGRDLNALLILITTICTLIRSGSRKYK